MNEKLNGAREVLKAQLSEAQTGVEYEKRYIQNYAEAIAQAVQQRGVHEQEEKRLLTALAELDAAEQALANQRRVRDTMSAPYGEADKVLTGGVDRAMEGADKSAAFVSVTDGHGHGTITWVPDGIDVGTAMKLIDDFMRNNPDYKPAPVKTDIPEF